MAGGTGGEGSEGGVVASPGIRIQRVMDDYDKCRKTVNQLQGSYSHLKRVHQELVKELRDAEAYIQVLEHECEMWKQQYYDLANGGEK